MPRERVLREVRRRSVSDVSDAADPPSDELSCDVLLRVLVASGCSVGWKGERGSSASKRRRMTKVHSALEARSTLIFETRSSSQWRAGRRGTDELPHHHVPTLNPKTSVTCDAESSTGRLRVA